MKSLVLLLTIVLLLTGCDESNIVDNPDDTYIPNLQFRVDTTYADGNANRFTASGIVKNNGHSKVTSPFHVEGTFYTNKTGNTKIGGSSTQIGVSLTSGQETFWKINYSSQSVNVTDYPDFSIRDLRGIYKK